MKQRTVLIVIPAYNEAKHINQVVRAVPKELDGGKERFAVKVVVVDDCSRDDTYNEAKSAGATVLRHVINSGAGAATRTGLRYAEQNSQDLAYVVTIDADGQHATEDVERLIKYAMENNAQMVVGNRLGHNKKDMPLHRTLGNRGLGLIGRFLFGITTEDTQSGLRLYRADIIPAVSGYTIDRYGFCTEMLWLAKRAGITVEEIPIAVRYSEETVANGQSNWGAVDLILDWLWIRISK